MQKIPALYSVIGVSVALAAIPAGAQSGPDLLEQLKIMRQQLEEQRARVDELERQLRASGVAPPANAAAAAPSQLERLRGTGNLPAARDQDPLQVSSAPPNLLQAEPQGAVPLAQPVYPARLAPLRGTGALADGGQVGSDPVGRPPAPRAPEVAPIFEAPGVLTPRGKLVFEPSVQYGYSSSNRVALVGYTVIPALLIGLLDVREVKRNTTTAAATFRYGFDNRLELEAKIPYVYRSDSTVSREIFTGTASERAFDTSGKGIGDIELAWR